MQWFYSLGSLEPLLYFCILPCIMVTKENYLCHTLRNLQLKCCNNQQTDSPKHKKKVNQSRKQAGAISRTLAIRSVTLYFHSAAALQRSLSPFLIHQIQTLAGQVMDHLLPHIINSIINSPCKSTLDDKSLQVLHYPTPVIIIQKQQLQQQQQTMEYIAAT